MTTYSVVQPYIGPSTPVSGQNNQQILVDTAVNNRIFTFSQGENGNNGIRIFNASSGEQSAAVDATSLFAGLTPPVYSTGFEIVNPFALTYAGLIVTICTLQHDGSAMFIAIDPATLTIVASFNATGNGNSLWSLPYRPPYPICLAPARCNGYGYVVAPALVGKTINVLMANGSTLQFAGHSFSIDEASACSIRTVDNSGIVYSAGSAWPGNYATTVGIYKTVISPGAEAWLPSEWPSANAYIATTKIGSFVPSDVDATWDTNMYISQLGYDQSDGNLLMFCSNLDATTKNYLVKISSADASILWATPVANVPSDWSTAFEGSNIQGGYFYYACNHVGGGILYKFNTSTGVATTTALNSTLLDQGAVYDYASSAVYCVGSWNGTTPPYPASGVTAFGTTWMRLQVAAYPAPTPGTPGGPATSRQRAWTYVLDGHTFYVLDLGAQGTFAYDVTTGQWTQYQDLNYVQWDVANGNMWGTRIIGGDLATDDVWEAAGSTLTDNGNPIPHVATGALMTRSRDYHCVSEVRLAVSKGNYDGPGGTTMNLRYSDDETVTWSAYLYDTLVEGQSKGSLSWRSLGAFQAPGRVFEVSDNGGPLRIDGCDAFIDDFDDDEPAPQSPTKPGQ